MDDIPLFKTGAARDLIDLRDYIYAPALSPLPAQHMPWDVLIGAQGPMLSIRNQGTNSTCVGQALASLIDLQLLLGKRHPPSRVSAAMLYKMALFHDLQHAPQDDRDDATKGVRSLRAAIKAFFHHGACLDDGSENGWRDDDLSSTWPSENQARFAADRTLGAYSRVQPILHHYHCAIIEAGAVLVTAQTHDGWGHCDDQGVIRFTGAEDSREIHAFLIVGYNAQGFLVQNSWGTGWGGVPLADGAARAPGMAIWRYADWARNVLDGWVLRLGVPGQEAFAVSMGEQGIGQIASKERRKTMPYRMLRGNFLNLDGGRWQNVGTYATPEPAALATIDNLCKRLASNESNGLVLSLPGVMEGEVTSFHRAIRLKNSLQPHGLDLLACFWSTNFAAEMQAVLKDIFNRCRQRVGDAVDSLDQLFEETARGAGQAFWRDIERQAFCAARRCDPGAWLWQDPAPTCEGNRGKLSEAFETLSQACSRAGKPLHILADGTGALVLDALLIEARGKRGTAPLDWVPPLGNLVLTFPAVPQDQAEERILPLARALAARSGTAARIFVHSPELEKRLTTHGYGGSVLHLVSRAFLEPRGRAMLGSGWPFSANKPDDHEAFFTLFEPSRPFRMEQGELDADPRLQTQVLQTLLAPTPPVTPQDSQDQPPFQESMMDSTFPARITLQQLQDRINDGALTAEEAQRYFTIDPEASGPFAPVLVVNPDLVEMPPGARSALALNSANAAARWLRLAAYHNRIGQGYDGPRIAAEGDSWYQYPLRLYDVIDYVADRFAVFDTSAAGDLLENMARDRDYIGALRQSGAEILLLSAGGNDVCAGGALAKHLEAYSPDLKPADYLKRSYQSIMDNAIAAYERICRDVNVNFPGVTIIVHGYDYVIPDNGRWLGLPMASRGITDRKLQRDIAAEMIDQFNRALRRMAQTMAHVAYVDCRGAVADHQWFDELHPDNAGFAKVSSRILTSVNQILMKSRAVDVLVKDTLPDAAPAQSPQRRQQTAQALAGPQNLARSLHLGLNAFDPAHYAGDSGVLYGCENDARAMRDLAEAQGYSPRMLLTPEATREAVIDELSRAARDLHAGDQFLFTVSSHGSQISDMNGDERDHDNQSRDSTLCLYDSMLVDDEMWNIFSTFRAGVRIAMFADSCHSGSVARAGIQPLLMAAGRELLRPPRSRSLSRDLAARVEAQNYDFYQEIARRMPHVDRSILTSPVKTRIDAAVIQFSACRDDQFALDGDQNGMFTSALLRVWDNGGFSGSYQSLARNLQQELAGSGQSPGLLDMSQPDPAFLQQRPFRVSGARLNQETHGTRMPEHPQHHATSALQSVETTEDDTPARDAPLRGGPADVPDDVVQAFRDFMAPLRLRHFQPQEFLALGSGHFGSGAAHGLNTAPPESLWPNIVPTALVLDALRDRLGAPLRINSAYRSPAYNSAIGGESRSWHMQFRACDITADGVSPQKVADTARKMRDEGLFLGGIGRYAGFTHIDTRGANVDWGSNRPRSAPGREPTPDLDPELAASRLLRIAETIPANRSRGTESADANDALNQALQHAIALGDTVDQAQQTILAAVNGAQLMAMNQTLSLQQRRAVLYSTQFAQRAADAAANPVKDPTNWWAIYNAALAAAGWIVNGSISRSATAQDLSLTLDKLALEVMTGLVGVGKLKAIAAVLDGLKNLAGGDERLVLLDSQTRRQGGGAVQIGEAELDGGIVAVTTAAVQFSASSDRQQILFAKWGNAVQRVWISAERLVLNEDFYFATAQPIIEQRLGDAAARILAFDLAAAPIGT